MGHLSRGRARNAILGASAGLVTFALVALAVTAVLDPFVWPSALVGLPVGLVAGVAAAVLGYHLATRWGSGTVDWRAVALGLVALVLVFGLVLGGLSLLGDQRRAQSETHTYDYQVTLSADRTVENVTVYVPVPAEGNVSAVGEQFVSDVAYSRDTPAVRGYDSDPAPVNFTYELVDTEHGRMLAVTADRIAVERVYYRTVENETMGYHERISESEYDPGNPDMGVQHDGRFQFTVSLAANDSIDTATPLDDEPVLGPAYDRTETECFGRQTERQRCYDYESRVYADYDTDAETTVSVGAELSGRNEWFAGGWTGNEYRDRVAVELLGPQDGWHSADGFLEIGSGRYRD